MGSCANAGYSSRVHIKENKNFRPVKMEFILLNLKTMQNNGQLGSSAHFALLKICWVPSFCAAFPQFFLNQILPAQKITVCLHDLPDIFSHWSYKLFLK